MALPPIRARRVQSRGLWVPGTQEPVSHRWQSYGGRRGTEVRFIARRWVPGIVENGTVRVGSIVIDVDNFDRMMAFWQAALRYVPVRPPTPGDPFVILKDPAGERPNVSIDQMPPERGRIHLDLYTDDQEGEVDRLLTLGATQYRPREPGEDFVVLEDPEGNLFCVVDTTSP